MTAASCIAALGIVLSLALGAAGAGSARAVRTRTELAAPGQAPLTHRALLPLVLRGAASLPVSTGRPPAATAARTVPAPTDPPGGPSPTAPSPATASPTPDGPPATATEPAPPTSTPTATASAPPAGCAPPPPFHAGLEPARIVWVDAGGDDQAGDGSADRPFATLRRAAREAAPGTALRLRPGRYAGGTYLDDLAGTADAPIWLGGVPGGGEPGPSAVVIAGASEGLHLTRARWVVVHDLTVEGASGNGINADDGGATEGPSTSHHLAFERLTIRDIGGNGNQDCLKLSGLEDVTVEGSAFARCGGGVSGSGIDMVGVHRARVVGNRFEDLSGSGVQAKGGSADVEVRGNRMLRAGARAVNMGGSTGFAFFRPPLDPAGENAEARDIRVVANLIEGSQSPIAFVGCVGCLAAHNTLVDPEIWVLRILQETTTGGGFAFSPARDGRFLNNLVVFRRGQLRTTSNVGPGTAPETFAFAHNLWYAIDAPGRSAPELPAPETNGVVGLDPRLGPDAAIGADSPAAGAGLPLAEAGGDLAGRCYADPPSIGAREVGP